MKCLTAAALLAAAPFLVIPRASSAQKPAPSGPAAATSAAPTISTPAGYEIPKDMTPYFVAILVKGPTWTAARTPEATELTRRHLSFIRAMIEQKKYLLAGPMLDGGHRQGIAIVAAASAGEAKRLVESDPAVAAGHMAVELHPAMLPSLASLTVRY